MVSQTVMCKSPAHIFLDEMGIKLPEISRRVGVHHLPILLDLNPRLLRDLTWTEYDRAEVLLCWIHGCYKAVIGRQADPSGKLVLQVMHIPTERQHGKAECLDLAEISRSALTEADYVSRLHNPITGHELFTSQSSDFPKQGHIYNPPLGEDGTRLVAILPFG